MTIRVRSVVGRFLEHSRVLCFDAGVRSTWYMGSANLMPRNLDHRLEALVPVEDHQRLQACLDSVFGVLLEDNTTAWTLKPDGSCERLTPKKGER